QNTVENLLGVQIDAFQSEADSRVVDPSGLQRSRRRPESSAELDIDDFLADVNGSGIREALRIILDYEFERPQVLLVEEPELHLHPALETSMMRYLKGITSDCQVIITTHSTNFLDTAEMRNVYLVSKPDSTEIQLLDYFYCNRSSWEGILTARHQNPEDQFGSDTDVPQIPARTPAGTSRAR
ncbi:MAG TPA: AAA family ATPase, partial [Gemmataceae bacterium]|nr:AAA family ATPase [Gemmataceae bacterium]